ncbi:hypothetical protein [Haloarcula sp. Atlit-7R]|uniref:hypothetical protein n=1 Tax=Haloarcula sp. Atlit-7R TaxID=2282125 RepID=UPI000EF13488|nr:hypothetical protein [Haloarcula sp. Atlit-7R]RLM97127.1 hypothetical protein D3D01_04785 [Haloarcula sp. Atlit-7R]
MSLQLDRSDTWTCALLGGLLAAPFTALQVIQSPDSIMFNMVVVGGALAGRFGGWLAERQGHPRVPAAGG